MLHLFRYLNRLQTVSRHAKTSRNMSQNTSKLKTNCSENKVEIPKDETIICGGSKCKPRKKIPCSPVGAGAGQASSEDLLISREKKCVQINKKQNLATIQGGGKPRDPCKPPKEKKPKHSGGGMKRWRNISLFAILPMVAILTALVFGTHKEHEHPEFVYYPHMYKRTKPYWFKDGNRTAFHNSHQNALPPAGYEDEIDEQGVGQEPETEKDKKQRIGDFEKLLKDWEKNGSGSAARVKPEAVAAEQHETAAETVQKNAEAEEKHHPEAAEKPKEVEQLYSKKLPIYDVEEEE